MSNSTSRRISHGSCALCGANDFAKRTMLKHFDKCPRRPLTPKDNGAFRILVSDAHDPRYWLFIEADRNSTLRLLDQFLREIWLECCGHMSAFNIGMYDRYVAPRGAGSDRSMNISLDNVLLPGVRFGHEYDFGSTTELILDVLGYAMPISSKKSPVRLLARNNPIIFRCKICKTPANTMCLECQDEADEEDSWNFCSDCLDNRRLHKHDDEGMRLPIVNSPRSGVCGYEG